MKLHILVVFCLLNAYAECKWRPEYHERHHDVNWSRSEMANEISTRTPEGSSSPSPPDHTKLIAMARYVLHNTGKILFQ